MNTELQSPARAKSDASMSEHFAVNEINGKYAECLDEKCYDDWPSFFTDPCVYQIYPRENLEAGLPGSVIFFNSQAMLRDRVLCIKEVNIYQPHTASHILSPARVERSDGGVLKARTNFLVYHSDNEGRSRLFAVGEYRDVLIPCNNSWKFQERIVILNTFTISSHLAEPL